jgi:class 3 adenylate cyclase
MRCPSCGIENPKGMKFCGQCASPLGQRCPQCGFDNPPGFAFCGQCAAPLTEQPPAPRPEAPCSYTPSRLAEKILTSRSALEGERKQVTVLFADMKGSMELLADRDPEDARRLLDPVLERMMDAVHRYEGTVNQVMGGGIMALFGAPIAHEDHAVRACYAALAMQALIKPYAGGVQRTQGVPLHIRVGLNSGEVVVRAIDNDLHMDYSAIGQTVHLAARMEQLATPGHILLTPATLRLVEGLVQVNALGPIPVKGLTAPVEGFELVGASAVRRRLQAGVARGLTRFVGRETEIAALAQALVRAGTGHGHVVAVVVEAGVGKSRLLYEFVQSHRTQGWRVLEAASVSYGKATPYFPVVDLLKRYLHIQDGDELCPVRDNVTEYLLTMHEAEALAAALDDQRRLAQVLFMLSNLCYSMGTADQAVAAGRRALALATPGGDVVLRALANRYLGTAYQGQGDYRRAINGFGQTMAVLDGAQRRERFGQVLLPAVVSCAYLPCCHAELGTFAEGRALGDEGLRIAEAVAQPASLMYAYWGVVCWPSARATSPGRSPCSNGPWASVRTRTSRSISPG